jgi:hypothetical protein
VYTELRIFYSWQSDLNSKYNRNFIKDCLERAVKKLNKELELNEPARLDQDTKDVAGTPDIANTIFAKIQDSAVFIGDVSFIAGGDGTKFCSNPNVMIELGYALSSLTDLCVVNVMNTAYGEAEGNLPFDLNHKRWPIRYELSADNFTKKNEVKESLVNDLCRAIKPILAVREQEFPLANLYDNPSLENIRHHILSAHSKKDWKTQSIDSRTTAIYSNNVNLRVEINYTDEGTQCNDFKEEWANGFIKPKAAGYWCDIYFGQSHIERTILVSVDEGRALLPLPRGLNAKGQLVVVAPFEYRIAELFDTQETLYRYFSQSGLEFGD